jgi:NitT/TauT family transport system substrate-binding protein
MPTRRDLLLSAGCGACAAALGVPLRVNAQEKPTIRFVLDWKYEGEHAQFTLPLTDGTFARLGLNVAMDRGNGSGDTISKVASGAYDLGLADTYAMVRFNAANPTNRLISVAMVQDASAVGIVAQRARGIKKPADLAGKKFYGPAADSGRLLFPIFAKLNGIDPNSIQWNTVSPDLRDTMLARGEADAVCSNLVTTIMNLRAVNIPESKLTTFYYGRYGIALYGSSLVTTKAFAEKNPEAIANFVRGLVHGLNGMIDDLDGAMASLKRFDNLLNDDVEKARMTLSLEAMLVTPNVLQNGFSTVDMARLEKTLQQIAPAFQIDAPHASEVYTDRFLPPSSERKIHPWKPPAH